MLDFCVPTTPASRGLWLERKFFESRPPKQMLCEDEKMAAQFFIEE